MSNIILLPNILSPFPGSQETSEFLSLHSPWGKHISRIYDEIQMEIHHFTTLLSANFLSFRLPQLLIFVGFMLTVCLH